MKIKRFFGSPIKLKYASEIPGSFETAKMTFCKAINNALKLTLENHEKLHK